MKGSPRRERFRDLPPPAVYLQEYIYWPWGDLTRALVEDVCARAPQNGNVVEYMCGFGFLLSEIGKRRGDLRLSGCSLDEDWIAFGRRRYPALDIVYADARSFVPRERPHLAICAGGFHHLEFRDQAPFLEKAEPVNEFETPAS